ncbi:MAG: two-component system response regulator [Kaistia sp. SCN 65-12]|nr:MAG: two-component system response regulator [Kaistia sp. SCN 65-12]
MSASILIADDDPNILLALSYLMRREGHAVRTATDGQQTLDAVAQAVPDLVLLDVMMPKANGYDVCRALRASHAYDGVRIVMLTAKGREADQQAGLALGADAYISKPFAIGDVVACVASVLAGKPGRTGAPGVSGA